MLSVITRWYLHWFACLLWKSNNCIHNLFCPILTQLSLRCQAWIETEYGHHNILNAGGSRTAESSIFSYDEVSLSDAGGGNKLESTYLYIQMEYCPRCVSFCSCELRKFVLLFLHYFFLLCEKLVKLLMFEPYKILL
jgi:hypothetical protein